MLTRIQKVNFLRVSRAIIDLFTAILRVHLCLYIAPDEVYERWQNDKEEVFNKLKYFQKKNIKLAQTQFHSYEYFDISSLYLTFRHVCNIMPPSEGWGLCSSRSAMKSPILQTKYPQHCHKNEGDDIERIHIIRNDLSHATRAELEEDDFRFLWDEMTDICLRMQIRHGDDTYIRILNHLRSTQFNEESAGIYLHYVETTRRLQAIESMLEDSQQENEETAVKKVREEFRQAELAINERISESERDRMEMKRQKNKLYSRTSGLSLVGGFLVFALIVILLLVYYQSENAHEGGQTFKLKEYLNMRRDLFWGTYMPSSYFAFSTRTIQPSFIRMIWLVLRDGKWTGHSFCDGRINNFGWQENDGTFGSQEITDHHYRLVTEYLQGREDEEAVWNIRITKSPKEDVNSSQVRLFLQVKHVVGSIDSSKWSARYSVLKLKTNGNPDTFINIRTEGTDLYIHNLDLPEELDNWKHLLHFVTPKTKVIEPSNKHPGSVVAEIGSIEETKIAIRISKENKRPMSLDEFKRRLSEKSDIFKTRINQVFQINDYPFTQMEKKVAKIALSSLLGGIGFFHGDFEAVNALSQKRYTRFAETVYTTTPSRVFHAHGHLWDEGFHHMILSVWNYRTSLEIICHWLDLIDKDGWIPRELILDKYSKLTVPSKFVQQFNDQGNPPTFIIALRLIAEHISKSNTVEIMLLKRIYEKTVQWFDWFLKSQAGDREFTYRWRGRDNPVHKNESNKMTMASGLDDYPRSRFPDEHEKHLDLRCWVTLAADTMVRLSSLVEADSSRYSNLKVHLEDENMLNDIHWDDHTKQYGDFGKVLENGAYRYGIVNEVGYVSIFPFILKLINPNSDKIRYILDHIQDRTKLWTDYGLRSLAPTSYYYQRKNDIDDKPQWRGSIRININYLALGALRHYSASSTLYGKDCDRLYRTLRKNIIKNVANVYNKTGTFYEQYNDNNGKGEGHFPYTGSTSLIVLIMSEIYH